MLFGVLLLSFGSSLGVAQAQTDISEPIDLYEGYPVSSGVVPEGCTAQGADLLNGVTYTLDTGRSNADLRKLSPKLGDVLTMSWDSIAEGCEDATITLSMKATSYPYFEITDNQYNVLSTACAPAGPTCASLGNSLSLNIQPIGGQVDCYQIDAHLGAPLNVVGPEGNYYGSLNGVHNVLIGAKNIGVDPCVLEPCSIDGIDSPAASPDCKAQAACALDDSLSADDESCVPCVHDASMLAGDPNCVPPATTTTAAAVVQAEAAVVTTAAPSAVLATDITLPRTGPQTAGSLGWLGASFILVGLGTVGAGRSLAERVED